MKGYIKTVGRLSAVAIAVMFSSHSYASGYKLEFESPSVLADAGEAAVVEDAGTNWYNSAGLVDVPRQIVASNMTVFSDTQFTGTTTSMGGVAGPKVAGSPGSASSYPHSNLPALHYNIPFASSRFAFGLTLTPAWGLMEQYGNNDSILRYDLTRIYTKTMDIAPSLAFRINKQWSVGVGPDFNYFQILSANDVNTAPTLGTTGDSISRYSASDWGKGWHAGVLFHLNDATRFGLNYRSKIVMHMHGYSDFAAVGGPFGGLNESSNFGVNIPLPPTTTFSVYHDMNQVWALMGTIAYDQWSVQQNLYGQNYAQPKGFVPSTVNVTVPQYMHNTFDFSLGTHYKLNQKWMLRGSLKYVAAPTNNAFRDVNNPDAPKFGINVGARYTMNQKLAFDLMYGHVFTRTVSINGMNPASGSTATGNVRTHIDVIGAQVVWSV